MLHNFPAPHSEAELNRLYRAIGDTTRRRIIDELAKRGGQSLFEICARLTSEHGITYSRQGFSRHLGVLEDVGIVNVTWQGTTKLHTLNAAPLTRLSGGWLSTFEEEQ
jgi:DNA-binding transcriptional ArsR family regulator